jgi:hypothetical protein
MTAAAAAKPMTVLRIVLTTLEKPSPSGGNTAISVVLPRAAIGVRGGRSPWSPRNLLLDHERGGHRTGSRISGESEIGRATSALGTGHCIPILDRDRRLPRVIQIPPQVATPNCGSFLKQAYRHVRAFRSTLHLGRHSRPVRPSERPCSQPASPLQCRADGPGQCRDEHGRSRARAGLNALGPRSMVVEKAPEAIARQLQRGSGDCWRQAHVPGCVRRSTGAARRSSSAARNQILSRRSPVSGVCVRQSSLCPCARGGLQVLRCRRSVL